MNPNGPPSGFPPGNITPEIQQLLTQYGVPFGHPLPQAILDQIRHIQALTAGMQQQGIPPPPPPQQQQQQQMPTLQPPLHQQIPSPVPPQRSPHQLPPPGHPQSIFLASYPMPQQNPAAAISPQAQQLRQQMLMRQNCGGQGQLHLQQIQQMQQLQQLQQIQQMQQLPRPTPIHPQPSPQPPQQPQIPQIQLPEGPQMPQLQQIPTLQQHFQQQIPVPSLQELHQLQLHWRRQQLQQIPHRHNHHCSHPYLHDRRSLQRHLQQVQQQQLPFPISHSPQPHQIPEPQHVQLDQGLEQQAVQPEQQENPIEQPQREPSRERQVIRVTYTTANGTSTIEVPECYRLDPFRSPHPHLASLMLQNTIQQFQLLHPLSCHSIDVPDITILNTVLEEIEALYRGWLAVNPMEQMIADHSVRMNVLGIQEQAARYQKELQEELILRRLRLGSQENGQMNEPCIDFKPQEASHRANNLDIAESGVVVATGANRDREFHRQMEIFRDISGNTVSTPRLQPSLAAEISKEEREELGKQACKGAAEQISLLEGVIERLTEEAHQTPLQIPVAAEDVAPSLKRRSIVQGTSGKRSNPCPQDETAPTFAVPREPARSASKKTAKKSKPTKGSKKSDISVLSVIQRSDITPKTVVPKVEVMDEGSSQMIGQNFDELAARELLLGINQPSSSTTTPEGIPFSNGSFIMPIIRVNNEHEIRRSAFSMETIKHYNHLGVPRHICTSTCHANCPYKSFP